MLSWENNFKSSRKDCRHLSSLAANREFLRHLKPCLAFNAKLNKKQFAEWKIDVKNKLFELLQIPDTNPQPEPVLLGEKKRDGYKIQRWEFFPDSWSVIRILILIPDSVSELNPGAAVLCIPGSATSKELLAGEELLAHPNCTRAKYPKRDNMAQHFVKDGIIAVAFDNPGTAELSELSPEDQITQWATRRKLCGELLAAGHNYLGLSVFQKLQFMEWFKKQRYVDNNKIAVCGHSLGSEVAMALGIIDDNIKAVIFNDFLCDQRKRAVAVTNLPDNAVNDGGNWHIVPGLWRYFSFPDLLASLAPKYLSINEGGAFEFIETVKEAYKINGCPENLSVNYYPKFSKADNRNFENTKLPENSLDIDDFFIRSYVDVDDHSFRPEFSVKWLKNKFGI